MGLLIYVALPALFDLSFLEFLAPLTPAFDIWVNTGWVWFLSFTSVAESLVYPLQFAFLFSSFSLLLWLPTVAGAKTARKIGQRGQTTFTVQPPYPAYTRTELPVTPPRITFKAQTAEPEQIPESQFEMPEPLQTFQALDAQTARLKAAEQGLITLYKEVDRWGMYGRRRVYWCLDPSFADRLLRLNVDMAAEAEFNEKEQAILRDLAGKRWLKRMKTGERTYYYHLDKETVQVLQKQLAALARTALAKTKSEQEIAEK